jgi:hypothetical protein
MVVSEYNVEYRIPADGAPIGKSLSVTIRVFTEVTFWNSAEYGILFGSDFTSAKFRGITAEFREISCTKFRIWNLSSKFMQKTLDFLC